VKISAGEMDEHIERWRDGEGQGLELHDWLGMTEEEHGRWAVDPVTDPEIADDAPCLRWSS
jgi:hypothetical protein